jgi:hypothetical protein
VGSRQGKLVLLCGNQPVEGLLSISAWAHALFKTKKRTNVEGQLGSNTHLDLLTIKINGNSRPRRPVCPHGDSEGAGWQLSPLGGACESFTFCIIL